MATVANTFMARHSPFGDGTSIRSYLCLSCSSCCHSAHTVAGEAVNFLDEVRIAVVDGASSIDLRTATQAAPDVVRRLHLELPRLDTDFGSRIISGGSKLSGREIPRNF